MATKSLAKGGKLLPVAPLLLTTIISDADSVGEDGVHYYVLHDDQFIWRSAVLKDLERSRFEEDAARLQT